VVGDIVGRELARFPDTPGKSTVCRGAVELRAAHQAHPDTTSASDPAFSPDGSRIALVSLRDGNAEIYVNGCGRKLARRESRNDPQPDGRPAFTPDGQALVFHSARTAGKQQVWTVNLDGTGLTQLTRDSEFHAPVSPDWPDDCVRVYAQQGQRHLADGSGRLESAAVHAFAAARERSLAPA